MEPRSVAISTGFKISEADAERVRRLVLMAEDIKGQLEAFLPNIHTSRMPDEDGTNTDHDKRYMTKSRVIRLIGGSPYGVSKLVAPDGDPDPAVSVANDGDVMFTTLTANRIVATNATQELASVTNLESWIAGTVNRISVTDDGDGTVTLNLPQDIHTTAAPQFARLGLGTAADDSMLLIGTTSQNGECVRILNPALSIGQSIFIAIGKQMASGKISQFKHYIGPTGIHQTLIGPNPYALRLTEVPSMDYAGTVFLTNNRLDDTSKRTSIRLYQWDNETETEGFTMMYAEST